jgi:hypothetical protein
MTEPVRLCYPHRMTWHSLCALALLLLAGCDQPKQPKAIIPLDAPGGGGRTRLSGTMALAEIYGNVDPQTGTAVWTRPDPDATEAASFDSVDGIPAQVILLSVTQLGPDRALVITAARDENTATGKPDMCPDCAVLLSAFTFERDSVGWRVVARREAAAQTPEKNLTTAVNLLVRSSGGAEVTLAGARLQFDSSGKLLPKSSK